MKTKTKSIAKCVAEKGSLNVVLVWARELAIHIEYEDRFKRYYFSDGSYLDYYENYYDGYSEIEVNCEACLKPENSARYMKPYHGC